MKKILFLAFHVSATSYEGGSQYCDYLADCIKEKYELSFFTKEGITRFRFGVSNDFVDQPTARKSTIEATLRTFVGSQYFVERMRPIGLCPKLLKAEVDGHDMIIVSFFHVYIALTQKKDIFEGKKVLILTHNFDLDIYDRWVTGHNLLRSSIGHLSRRRYARALRTQPSTNCLASISVDDREKYERVCNTESMVLEVASAQPYSTASGIRGKDINLCFVGSLSTPFNIESIEYFSNDLWPSLRKNKRVKFHLVGSYPKEKLIKLCKKNNWKLHANLPDKELDICLSKMNAGVLPFKYSQGVKLKAWKLLSVGLPIMATSIFRDYKIPQHICLCSDSTDQWQDFIVTLTSSNKLAKEAHAFWLELQLETRKANLEKISKFLEYS